MLGLPTVRSFLARGYKIRALVRHSDTYPFAHPSLTCITGDLRSVRALTEGCKGADAVIHFAGKKNDESDSAQVNVRGTRLLAETAQREKVTHFLFMSTASVYLPHKGLYATTKLQGEQVARTAFTRVSIIRPSVIYSSLTEGILGSLVRSLRTPFPYAVSLRSASFYPIHIVDFISVLEHILMLPPHYHVFDVGGTQALTLSDMQTEVMNALSLHKRLFSLSPSALYPFAVLFSVLCLPFPFTKSNVLGAMHDIHFRSSETMQALGIIPRSFKKGIEQLVQDSAHAHPEADVLLRYVCPPSARQSLGVREYHLFETACRTAHLKRILPSHLPSLFRLRGLDMLTRFFAPQGHLQRKLLIACALIEISPSSAQQLLRPPHPFIQASLYVTSFFSTLLAGISAFFLLCTPGGMKRYA